MQPDVKRFSTRRHTVKFFVDDDLLEGVPALPAYTALELMNALQSVNGASGVSRIDAAIEIFSHFLQDESFALLKRRLGDKTNPIDLKTLVDILQWVIGEAYGLRPTQQHSSSESGVSEAGSRSTDGALPVGSIPEVLTGVATSTSSTTS